MRAEAAATAEHDRAVLEQRRLEAAILSERERVEAERERAAAAAAEEHRIRAAAEAKKGASRRHRRRRQGAFEAVINAERERAAAAAAEKQRVAAVTSSAANADRDGAIAPLPLLKPSSAAFRKSSSAGQLRNDSGKHSGRRN